jgi:hypothetical protein
MQVVIAGGRGFLGSALADSLRRAGHAVRCLERKPRSPEDLAWQDEPAWRAAVERADALVNLAGAPVACRWTPENRREILASRVESTTKLAEAMGDSSASVWLNASAVGYYGDGGDWVLDEASPRGSGFLADVCAQWEEVTSTTRFAGPVALLRTGVVLDAEHGALVPLARLARAFAGGAAGNGRQFMPWIHRADWVAAARHLLERPISGPVNLVGPNPVPNGELMQALREVVHRPWSPPVPAFVMRWIGHVVGPDASIILEGQRAVPKRLFDNGFRFRFSDIKPALKDLLV